MNKLNEKLDTNIDPDKELGDLIDAASEIDENNPQSDNSESTITSDDGEIIELDVDSDTSTHK